IGVDAMSTTSSTRSPRTRTRGGGGRTGLVGAAVTTRMVAMRAFAQGRGKCALVRFPAHDAVDDGHARTSGDRHHPHPVNGRGPEGQLRAPRRADGRRADGLRSVDPLPAPRPDTARLDGPGSVRALRRPRVDAPL